MHCDEQAMEHTQPAVMQVPGRIVVIPPTRVDPEFAGQPAGWYPDTVPDQLRHWNGHRWTGHVRATVRPPRIVRDLEPVAIAAAPSAAGRGRRRLGFRGSQSVGA